MRRQAQRWANRMNEDPDRHTPGLARWIGDSEERRKAYNGIADAMRLQTWSASHLYETRQRSSAGGRTPRSIVWVAAAILVGLAAAVFGIMNLFGATKPSATPEQTTMELRAPDGDRTIILSDGSQVLLYGGSRIDVRITRDTRRIALLDGRAQFKVTHAASWPFIVSAGGGSVTARGTVFEVGLGDHVVVKLTEGAIDVAIPGQIGGQQPIVRHLVAGQSTDFVAKTEESRLISAPAPVFAPKGPAMKDFDDVTVNDVIAQTNQGSATKIELADPALGALKVVLQLHTGDADDVAEGLAEHLGLAVDRSRPGTLVLQANL